jgi:hypothetical protein
MCFGFKEVLAQSRIRRCSGLESDAALLGEGVTRGERECGPEGSGGGEGLPRGAEQHGRDGAGRGGTGAEALFLGGANPALSKPASHGWWDLRAHRERGFLNIYTIYSVDPVLRHRTVSTLTYKEQNVKYAHRVIQFNA